MSTKIEQLLIKNASLRYFTAAQRHKEFAYEYLVDRDIGRAYLATVAKNENNVDEHQARKMGSRLLLTPLVQQIIDEETCKFIITKREEKEEVIKRLKRVYLQAMGDRDYPSAVSALDKLMKHYGMYEQHNKQKRYSPDDVAAIRAKLEAQGISFDDANKPKMIEETPIGLNGVEDVEIIKQEVE